MTAAVKHNRLAFCIAVFSIANLIDVTAFLVKPTDTLVLHGDSTQLNCTYNGAPELKAWYCGSQMIFLGNQRRESPGDYELVGDGDMYNLIVHNATIEDEEEYICTDLDNPEREAVASLYVIENSTLCAINQTNTTVITGDDVTFICTMELDEESPGDLAWYRDGSEVSRVTGMENVWTTTLYDGDNGATFYCRLEHFTLPVKKWTELTCEDSITMDVQFPPSILTKDKEILTEIGDNVTLVCEADAYPVAVILWSDSDDQPITGDEPNREILTPEPEGTISTSTLHMTDIKDSDFGEYTCTATNDIGEDSHTREITSRYPRGPPIILTKDVKVLEVEINNNVTLVCEADAYPVATLSWYANNDGPITGDEPNRVITTPEPKGSITTSTLHIFEMQDPDFGEYTCEAVNDLGHDSHTGEIIRKYAAESLLWGLLLIILLIVLLVTVLFVLLYLHLRNNRKSSKTKSQDETDSGYVGMRLNDQCIYANQRHS